MRHNVFGRKLNRNCNQRKALFRSLVINLFLNGRIITTEAKAKAVKNLVDKLITKAKKQDLAGRRQILAEIPDRKVVEKLYREISPHFKNVTSGFTRIVKIGRRKGDMAKMVIMELVTKPQEKEIRKE